MFSHHIRMSRRHSVGDTKVPFCLQSCVKPLEYAIAVHDLGTERTHQFVGKEPSGFKFNKLSLDEEGKACNQNSHYNFPFLYKNKQRQKHCVHKN